MKNSIARSVTRRVLIILLISFAVLLAGSFAAVYQIIYSKSVSYSDAILGVFSDLIVYEADKANAPVNDESADLIKLYGDYFCKWYGVDYAGVFVPDIENNTATYICAVKSVNNYGEPLENNLRGKKVDYVLSQDEKDVWDSKRMFAQTTVKDAGRREIRSVYLIEDGFGNKALAAIDMPWNDTFRQILGFFLVIAAVIAVIIILIYITVLYLMKKRISIPAKIISKNMQDFITDGNRSREKLPVTGSDEYSMIADAFNCMAADIDSYIENINALNSEQERSKAELDIASKLQRGFLPASNYETDLFRINATMAPARDVGGDLYDYLKLDDDRLLLVVADVSGKGVSAAIFMVVILTLIRQYARLGLCPAEILQRTNDTLAEKNGQLLFATIFIGIYDAKKGTFTYSNAGHNPPFIVGKELKKLDEANGSLLGIFPGEIYEQAEVGIGFGETLFMFTDGVTESTNSEKQFFGDERLRSELIRFRKEKKEDAVAFILDSINEFTGNSDRHDDITILSMTSKQSHELLLSPDAAEFEKIKEELLSIPFSRKTQLEICLAAEECFINICSYAFADKDAESEKISFTLTLTDRLEIRFEDGGTPFNPISDVEDPTEYDEDRIGGLGRFIAFSIVDDVKYEYKNGKNILTLIKYPEEDVQ